MDLSECKKPQRPSLWDGRCGFFVRISRAELPNLFDELRANWFLILPLAALVWLLFAGFTPLFAGAVGVALTVIIVIAIRILFMLLGRRVEY